MNARTHRNLGLAFLLTASTAWGAGAVLHKSGAIQITPDGAFVWAVNQDHDSVSRLRTSDLVVDEFPLPAADDIHNPRGLAIRSTANEVWVACHGTNFVYVLDAASGAIVDTLVMPWGSGPASVAISPNGALALVALHRSGQVAQIDANTRTVLAFIDTFRRPFGITFTTGANEAWVTHLLPDGEDSMVSAIDTLAMNVKAQVVFKSVNPKEVNQIAGDPTPIPEGGYILTRGHVAQRPTTNHLWLPVQYQNFHNDVFTPDGTVQVAMHKIDLATQLQVPNSRVVLSAVFAHNNTALLGPGWNAGISGGVDLAFNSTGSTAYLVNAQSNDVVVIPTNIGMSKPVGSPPLVEIPVGDNPLGIAASPTSDLAYVMNYLSRDVSVINVVTGVETARVPMTPVTPEPHTAAYLTGAKLFNGSTDPRISSNDKVSCASCHPNAEMDGLPWQFSQFGAGTRKTLQMTGLNLAFGPQVGGRGQLHRSGDRDEVQDFEFTARGPLMGGTGFLTSPNPALGAPNAGLNADLDALATYVLSQQATRKSPHRDNNGSLSEEARRGAAIYKNTSGNALDVDCYSCHPAPNFTDQNFHDVGGHTPAPENEGPAFNTPSLVGAWDFGPYVQAMDSFKDANTLGGVLRDASDGSHGDTGGLNRTQIRDLEAFLNSIDGEMAATGIAGVDDNDPPRVLAVKPVSPNSVEVIFSETVDPATAGNPNNYTLSNGQETFDPSTAVVNAQWGNRVRLTVALPGCPATYTLFPGPIEDVAGLNTGGPNNVLDVGDPQNNPSFTLNGSITVTFGDTGLESFGNTAKDASTLQGLTSWSHSRWWLYPFANPKMKGFVQFDFVNTLMTQCGVTDPADILDARFSGVTVLGHRNTLELRRCFMPWGEPPIDWCQNCAGAVTMTHSTYPTIPWHQQGGHSKGGSGTSPSEYYPTATFDVANAVDATVAVSGIHERIEFAGSQVTDAFRFWFANPTKNYGYSVEIVGASNLLTEFHGTDDDDGKHGMVLSITFAIQGNRI